MAEYIEREQVKDELLSWAVCINHPEHLLKEDALCVIDAIPAADVVPVVRCKDCKHGVFGSKNCVTYCRLHRINTVNERFCSEGKRRYSDG